MTCKVGCGLARHLVEKSSANMALPHFVQSARYGRRTQKAVPILQHVEESRLWAVAMARQHADKFVCRNRIQIILQILAVLNFDFLLFVRQSTQHLADSLDAIGGPLVADSVFVIFRNDTVVRGGKPSIRRIERAWKLIERDKSVPFAFAVTS